jgi:nicotinate-nucleotide adenylyltransferase
LHRVGIFGGSFDPPHVGHVLAVHAALMTGEVDECVVVPCFRHAFDKSLQPFDDRMAMCRIAFEHLNRTSISEVERILGHESFTVRTLQYLQGQNPSWAMRLIVGTDVVADIRRWLEPETVMRLAPLIVVGRQGYDAHQDHSEGPRLLPEISSTQIRGLLNASDLAGARGLVPTGVLAYIESKALYR